MREQKRENPNNSNITKELIIKAKENFSNVSREVEKLLNAVINSEPVEIIVIRKLEDVERGRPPYFCNCPSFSFYLDNITWGNLQYQHCIWIDSCNSPS